MADKVRLTPGERLLTWRRRTPMNQDEAARYLGVCRTTYSRMERDLAAVACGGEPFAPPLDPPPRPHEVLYLLRRRSGATAAEVAGELCVSRVTLLKWEKAGDRQLLVWWENREK